MEQTTGSGLAGRLGEDPAEAAILDAARSSREVADRAEVDLAVAALAWCHTHPGDATTIHGVASAHITGATEDAVADAPPTATPVDTATTGATATASTAASADASSTAAAAGATPGVLTPTATATASVRAGSVRPGGETVAELAGPGAPGVAEFCVAEFAAAARMSTQAGAHLLGNVLELAYRLPRLWSAVLEGRIQVWRARRVADHTTGLSLEAAGWVDTRLQATRLTSIGPRTIEKLIQAALAEYDPEEAEARRRERLDQRRVDIPTRDVDINGLVPIYALLDAPDALDLDATLNDLATHLGALGYTQPHRVRRAIALGHLTRYNPQSHHNQPGPHDHDQHGRGLLQPTLLSAGPTPTPGHTPAPGGAPALGGGPAVCGSGDGIADSGSGLPPTASPPERSGATPTGAAPTPPRPPVGSPPGGPPPAGLPPDGLPRGVTCPLPPDPGRTVVLYVHIPAEALTNPPSTPLPSTPLPNTALPEAALPGAALPDAALPGAAQPGAALAGAALAGAALPDSAQPGGVGVVGRLANTRSPVLAQTIREWCRAAAKILVRPVMDLNSEAHVEAYEIPDRIHEQIQLRDVTGVFPYCTRPAVGCDSDHITPYATGGPTSTNNLAALCRHHHRLKTHTPWRYDMATPTGTYLWTSPTGHHYQRDHTGATEPGSATEPESRTWKAAVSRAKATTTTTTTTATTRGETTTAAPGYPSEHEHQPTPSTAATPPPRPTWLQPTPPGPRTRPRTLEAILTPPPQSEDPGEPPF